MPLSLSPYTLLLQHHFFSTYFGFRLAQRTSPKRRNCSLSTVVITEFKKRRLRRRGQREEIYKDL